MTILMNNTGPSLTEEHLREFEVDIGYALPSDFHTFLLQHNGGQPTPSLIDIDGLPGTPTDVQVFFGLDDPIASCDLRWNMRELAGRIRIGLCPIACDSGGNLYCLSLSGLDIGAIYYEDLEPETGARWYGRPEPEDRREYKVASSFPDFLLKLHD